ncbi:hypothetical protein CY34DRAFT_798419 [Suillus luteus UH-Slu-Lm8-n1]|uniref:Uncharacterized protein n=1 Tax=Suillus luteus UH-Slu-Lm8-n1 TaxID=930992 RepID=A0A0D0BRL1_9AGAM|nr:hypothetical protein CY34DRAFT_798419 [Suillus luteus UH-Slu-Lm8-n1]
MTLATDPRPGFLKIVEQRHHIHIHILGAREDPTDSFRITSELRLCITLLDSWSL